MNDKTVIKTISNIYFTIITLFTFIFLALSLVFVILQNGIYIDDISVPNVKIKQLYIKWNEKISISAKNVKITQEKKSNKELSHKELKQIFTRVTLFRNWLEYITIDNIQFNDINASFKYKDSEDGFLIVSSKDFSLKTKLYFESDMLNAKIEELIDTKRKIQVNGQVSLSNELEITLSLQSTINNEIFLDIYAFANKEKLFYTLQSQKNIKSIKHTVNIAKLPKEVQYWAFDAIDMSYLKLKKAHGWIEYADLNNAYKNLYIDSYVKDLHYTYNSTLDAVHAETTRLQFKNGVLVIHPKKAYSYNQFLGKSWINVDFTKKEEILDLYLLFDGKLNKDMLKILDTYKIKLPFLQKQGSVAVNLNISVGLRSIDVKARGDFFTKKANFDYLGLNIDISDAFIKLDNYDVLINKMSAKYKDIASTKVKVAYNAKTSTGKIKFQTKDISLKEQQLSLATKNLNITYNIIPNNDNISIEKSNWIFYNESVEVEALEIPFDLEKLIIDISPTMVSIKDAARLYISGKVNVRTLKSDLDIDLLDLSYEGINLTQSNAQAKLIYDKNIKIDFDNKVLLSHKKTDYSLEKLSINMLDKKIKIKSSVKINDIIETKIALNYNTSINSGILALKNTKIQNSDLGSIFSKKSRTYFTIKKKDEILILESKELDTKAVITNSNWFLNIDSIEKIVKYSNILQSAKISNGGINVYNTYSNDISFSSSFKYPHKILVINNKPVENYDIYGEYHIGDKSTSMYINNLVHIDIDKEIKIETKNIGLDLNELVNIFENNDTTQSKSKKSIDMVLEAKNSYLYISKDRHVISDIIDVQYFNNILTAQLIHKQGSAGFKFHDEKFHLYGENFSDIFMDNLFALSKFQGGILDFSMQGTTQEYTGIVNIKNTTILDYKILNNILAFVNTIPSLITFSLPEYSKYGLKVQSAYLNFSSKNDIFNISDINLNAKELNILGRGTASYKNNSVDIKLNLKTDLGSSASKIPIVGYILFDEDSMSTSMSITGELKNPKVKSLIAQEIIVNPLNIIKRTILLPYHLLSDINLSSSGESEEDIDIDEEL